MKNLRLILVAAIFITLFSCEKEPEKVIYNALIRVDYKNGGIYDTSAQGTYIVFYNSATIGKGKGDFFKQKMMAYSGDKITFIVENFRKDDSMVVSVKTYEGETFLNEIVTGDSISKAFSTSLPWK